MFMLRSKHYFIIIIIIFVIVQELYNLIYNIRFANVIANIFNSCF